MADPTAYDVQEVGSGSVLGLRLDEATAAAEADRLNADVAAHNERVRDQVESNVQMQAEWDAQRGLADALIAPDLVEVDSLLVHQGEPLRYEPLEVPAAVEPEPEEEPGG